jgi:hypothetical protein
MDNTEPVIKALAATFLALGAAGGKENLQQAAALLCDLVDSGVTDRKTSDILRSLIVAAAPRATAAYRLPLG